MDDKVIYIGFEFILLFAFLVGAGALFLYLPWPANLLSIPVGSGGARRDGDDGHPSRRRSAHRWPLALLTRGGPDSPASTRSQH